MGKVADSARNALVDRDIAAEPDAVDTQRVFDDKVMRWQADTDEPHITTMGRLYQPPSISGAMPPTDNIGHEIEDGVVLPPVNIDPPTIPDPIREGDFVTVTPGNWNTKGTRTYEWKLGGVVVSTNTSYQVDPGDGGQTLVCEETLTNIEGTATAASNSVVIDVIELPGDAINLVATGEVEQISMTWSFQTGDGAVEAVEIERRTVPGSFQNIHTEPGVITSYTDTTAVPGQLYGYRVRGTNADGAGGWSNEEQATAQPAAGDAYDEAWAALQGEDPNAIFLTLDEMVSRGNALFTDLAGTNPAGLNDPVAHIKADGRNLIADAIEYAPTLRQDAGGHYYLEANSVAAGLRFETFLPDAPHAYVATAVDGDIGTVNNGRYFSFHDSGVDTAPSNAYGAFRLAQGNHRANRTADGDDFVDTPRAGKHAIEFRWHPNGAEIKSDDAAPVTTTYSSASPNIAPTIGTTYLCRATASVPSDTPNYGIAVAMTSTAVSQATRDKVVAAFKEAAGIA